MYIYHPAMTGVTKKGGDGGEEHDLIVDIQGTVGPNSGNLYAVSTSGRIECHEETCRSGAQGTRGSCIGTRCGLNFEWSKIEEGQANLRFIT